MSSALPDDEGEGLDGSCDFSFSQYPPVQLPLDPTRHVKQPLPGMQPFLFSLWRNLKIYNGEPV